MEVRGAETLATFIMRHPDAKSSLTVWKEVIESNRFKHFPALKSAFGTADYVKPYTVFDIAGNKCRLITIVSYSVGIVFIDKILTHAEYDKWNKMRRK